MIFDNFINLFAFLYTVRQVANHGHRAEAVLLIVVAGVVRLAERPLARLCGDVIADARKALGWDR